jgi:hypothetical protein
VEFVFALIFKKFCVPVPVPVPSFVYLNVNPLIFFMKSLSDLFLQIFKIFTSRGAVSLGAIELK